MIFKEATENFNPKFEVVGCFVENNGAILLLHRQDHKPEGGTWGVPAGKVDDGEEVSEAMARELQEETGIVLPSSELAYFTPVFARYDEYDFIFHIFHTTLDERECVCVQDSEHKEFRWVSPRHALEIPLIHDLGACIKLYYAQRAL